MQDAGDGIRPVAYISHFNSATQAKYGITQLECLAVVWALKAFRHYVYGRTVRVITGNAALTWAGETRTIDGPCNCRITTSSSSTGRVAKTSSLTLCLGRRWVFTV